MPSYKEPKPGFDEKRAWGVYIDFTSRYGQPKTQIGDKMVDSNLRLKTILSKYTPEALKAIYNFFIDIQCFQLGCTKDKITAIIPGDPFDTLDPDLPGGSSDPKHMAFYKPPKGR